MTADGVVAQGGARDGRSRPAPSPGWTSRWPPGERRPHRRRRRVGLT
ncbi:MAG: hypothetical protein M0C28_13805 [Candidatus Moduliflexus flocculans]|nr:hypothetical protein [Candidatus Moduliflexus flocculans]